MRREGLFAVLVSLSAFPVLGQGTIADPPATFVLDAGAFSGSPSANITGVSATLGQDHLFETGCTRRRP